MLQDPQGLISLFNSSRDFEQHLETFFAEHVKYTEQLGEAVPNPYFWQVSSSGGGGLVTRSCPLLTFLCYSLTSNVLLLSLFFHK